EYARRDLDRAGASVGRKCRHEGRPTDCPRRQSGASSTGDRRERFGHGSTICRGKRKGGRGIARRTGRAAVRVAARAGGRILRETDRAGRGRGDGVVQERTGTVAAVESAPAAAGGHVKADGGGA